MARSSNKDPLDKFRWKVDIDGFSRLGFTSVQVPSVNISTNSYAEGGSHLFPKKIIDSVRYEPVILLRGVTSDKSFNEWAKSYFNLLLSPSEPAVSYRKDVTIEHLDRAGRSVRTYTLYGAFPIEYKPASDFSSDGDDTVSIEKLTLEYESFEVKVLGQDNTIVDTISDVTKRLIRG